MHPELISRISVRGYSVVGIVRMRIWAGLLLVLCLSAVATADGTNENLLAELSDLRQRISELEAQEIHHYFFMDEARRLREDAARETALFAERIDRERESFFNLMMRSLTIAGFVATVTGVLLGRDYWNIRKELISSAKEQIASTARELESEAEKAVRERLQIELNAIDDELRHLKRVVRREVQYRNAMIALVAEKEALKSLTHTEVSAIDARGLNITPVELGQTMQTKLFTNIDLIVYHYEQDGEEERRVLAAFLKKLEGEFAVLDTRPPVIIYTKQLVKGVQAIEDYRMATFANSLPALVSQVLVQAFFLLRTEERTS